MDFVRAATPATDPRFAEMVVELVAEQVRNAPARRCSQVPAAGQGVNGMPCVAHCCEPVR
jgi:ferrochelatase